MHERLARLWSAADTDGHNNILASDGEIAFEGVAVITPANATLVKDLSLRVPRGTNLLVTGPNGSGMGICNIFFGVILYASAGRLSCRHVQNTI